MVLPRSGVRFSYFAIEQVSRFAGRGVEVRRADWRAPRRFAPGLLIILCDWTTCFLIRFLVDSIPELDRHSARYLAARQLLFPPRSVFHKCAKLNRPAIEHWAMLD